MSLRLPLSLGALLALATSGFAQTDATPKPKPARKPLTFHVAMRDGLRFDPPRLSAQPGDEIIIQLENADSTHQTHNFLVAQPGQREAVVLQSLALGEKGPSQNFVPIDSAILVHSALLDPEKKATIQFKLPDAPGIYPYVCTFPGHGMVMYGALYSGVKMPPLASDPNLPPTIAQTMVTGGGRRPFVQRMFMPDAGPAAIAVALKGDQNFCWDAGQCRLRYVWSGAFIDAGAYWAGNGRNLAKLPEEPWWSAPANDFPLRFGTADAPAPAVKFLGYRLMEGVPEFHYRAGGAEVWEMITVPDSGKPLALRYRITGASGPVICHLPSTDAAQWTSTTGLPQKTGAFTLTAAQAADFTLTLTPTR